MKTYNLKVTSKQMWLIQTHIYDMCNFRFGKEYTDDDFKKMDTHDVFRIKIEQKEKRVGKSCIFELTEKEAKFISSEIDYFVFDLASSREDKDRFYYSERQMAKRIIKNINNLLDTQYQRNLTLDKILR